MSISRIAHGGSAGAEAGRFDTCCGRLAAFLLLLGFLFTSLPAFSDAIVITKAMTASTIAEIFIEESLIRAEIEIGGPDLVGFRHLMPDGVYERLGFEPRPLAERLATFFGEDLVFSG